MKIAVSGADGFLGSHILEQLQPQEDIQVVGISLFPKKVFARFGGLKGLSVVSADSSSISATAELDDVDVYIACAFPRAVGSDGMTEGLDFVYQSLEMLLAKGCRSVINISSQSVYDPCRTTPAREDDKPLLTSTYAATKYCVELSVSSLCSYRSVPYANVRMASLIGPGFDQRFVNKMVRSAFEEGVVRYVEGESRHSFLDVQDAARGILALSRSSLENASIQTVNLGACASYTVADVAACVADVTSRVFGRDVRLEKSGVEKNTTCSALDSSKVEAITGWKPRITLAESVEAISKRVQEDAAKA